MAFKLEPIKIIISHFPRISLYTLSHKVRTFSLKMLNIKGLEIKSINLHDD